MFLTFLLVIALMVLTNMDLVYTMLSVEYIEKVLIKLQEKSDAGVPPPDRASLAGRHKSCGPHW